MKEEKRQDLPVGLWVVATPIGNLGDVTERARAALAQADAILCEDTRHTAQLLSALGIPAGGRLHRLDAHAMPATIARETARLRDGRSVALVTDAGTPGISDPGARLVRSAREAGITVIAVPGPSAVTALLSIAGFESPAFAFRGFFPRRAGERENELRLAAEAGGIFAWFESPQRVTEALEALAGIVPDAAVIAVKELTKLHERAFTGSARVVAEDVRAEIVREGARGEWCFAVELVAEISPLARESSDWVKALHCLLDARIAAPEAAKRVSQRFGVDRKDVYARALALSGKISPKKPPGGD